MERVLQVVGKMDYGGIQTVIMNTYRAIDRTAVQFDFLTHTEQVGAYDEEIQALGGNIYRMPATRPTQAKLYLRHLNQFFSNHPYRVVHGHVDARTALYLFTAKKYGAKMLIAHSHGTNAEVKNVRLLLRIAHMHSRSVANRFVACSREAGIWMFGKKATSKGRVVVIPNGIDAAKFSFNENTCNRMRAELGIVGKLVFGHAGRFVEVKNHAFLLDTFRLIKDKLPNAVLLLLGEGPLMDTMRQKADSLGLSDDVIFAGVRYNVPDYLQAMDVFLLPSLHEGLPLALVEAQAAGLPCVAANTISTETRITNLLEFLPIVSPSSWADRVVALAPTLPPRRDMTNAIQSSGFDISTVTQTWLALYGIDQHFAAQKNEI